MTGNASLRHVEALSTLLAAHTPRDATERASLDETLHALDVLPDPLNAAADRVHVTASAIVLDGTGRVLLHRHRRIGRWMQPGGHLLAGEAPEDAAVRETREETGLTINHPGARPLLAHVDVHDVDAAHRHLDLRFVGIADSDTPLDPEDGESRDIAWFDVDGAFDIADASCQAAIRAALRRTVNP